MILEAGANRVGMAVVICPTGWKPGTHRRQAQKSFVAQALRTSPIFSIDPTNLPDGQITRKSVKPLVQKYSDFPKSQINLYSERLTR
jgi:hypothetical protein